MAHELFSLDLTDINLPSDYSFQGEYRGETHGAQVISLDNGKFQAVLFVGGLPGEGWNLANRSLIAGNLVGNIVLLRQMVKDLTTLMTL